MEHIDIVKEQGSTLSLKPVRILRLPEVIERVGLRRASIYQFMADDIFPKSVPLGPRAVGWLEHEVERWVEERVRRRLVCKPRIYVPKNI